MWLLHDECLFSEVYGSAIQEQQSEYLATDFSNIFKQTITPWALRLCLPELPRRVPQTVPYRFMSWTSGVQICSTTIHSPNSIGIP